MMRTTSLSLLMMPILLLFAGALCRAEPPQPPSALEKAAAISYYPSLHKLAVRWTDAAAIGTAQQAAVQVRRKDDLRPLAQGKLPLSPKGGQVVLDLPALADGIYDVHLSLPGGPTAVKRFKHKNYPWLGNELGKTGDVYPPFRPVKVEGRAAEVVLRTYTFNDFGLWDSVKSQGKEILAAPIRLRVETAVGEQDWQFAPGQWTDREPRRAVYETAAAAPAVEVRTKSALEYEGCMKVEMDLLPGKQPQPVRRLWLEIPLKDKEAPLFHYCAMDGMRRNYAGKTPRGGRIVWGPQATQGWLPPLWKAEPGGDDGLLWTCRDIRPNQANVIPTDFVPYVWLGGGERGLAFFAANDKGYILDLKGRVQTIERRGGVLYLRVELVNKPSTITAARHLVFGLQASPTRPMRDGWRGNPNLPPPHGGPVVCWGGYHCADKYYQRVWTLMNELTAKGISPFPLGFTQHVTNTCVLPLNTWNTASLDLEWRWYDEAQWKWGATANPIPFPADLLLTETTGRQTGSYGHALFDLNSRWNDSRMRPEWGRSEWGMRIVHEILRQAPFAQHAIANRLEKALRDFGYGSKDCQVVNYWSDDPPLSVSDENTKWLLVVRKKDRGFFLVLQTWNKATTEVAVKIDPARLGFTPARGVWDVDGSAALPVASATDFRVSLAGPYGTRVLQVHAGAGHDR